MSERTNRALLAMLSVLAVALCAVMLTACDDNLQDPNVVCADHGGVRNISNANPSSDIAICMDGFATQAKDLSR